MNKNEQMRKLVELSSEEAKGHFLKGSSYFNADIPSYISFEPILNAVASVLKGKGFTGYQKSKPKDLQGINYELLANKDGRFTWRPFELIHPAIYVSLVDTLCDPNNWAHIQKRFSEFKDGVVDCCSTPVISTNEEKDQATQIKHWWQEVEQKSLIYSLEFSHILHTDVIDCYGSLYTHSIVWALHGLQQAKKNKGDYFGDKIDQHIQAGRYGQTNGISQGSVLMDFVAEIVLGYVDEQINSELHNKPKDFRIVRYRDDYRIFANSDDRAEAILKVISDKLRSVGMKLGVSKTLLSKNVVEGAIKPDKLAGIDLQDLGNANAKTIQKQLLRLHSFGQRFPNSGSLRRLVGEFHNNVFNIDPEQKPDDLEVLVAIATDIGFVSPATFPAVAGILSKLISLASPEKEKTALWEKVRNKMARVPYNGYLEIWLQRVTLPRSVGILFKSDERICQIVDKNTVELWENRWISNNDLKDALEVSKIVVGSVSDAEEVMKPKEVELFKKNAWAY
jgi:hypothetical protein